MVKCGFFLLSRGLPSQRSTWESVMTAGPVRFPGSRPAAFAFFRELRDNNDPAWFKPRKGLYEAEVLAPFRQLIAAVSEAPQPGCRWLAIPPAVATLPKIIPPFLPLSQSYGAAEIEEDTLCDQSTCGAWRAGPNGGF
jgi:Conserved hypothetical protein (DUF2461)